MPSCLLNKYHYIERLQCQTSVGGGFNKHTFSLYILGCDKVTDTEILSLLLLK